jgi:hypothetical protein
MDRYHIALFVHLLAVVVAAGATAVTKLAATRGARAKTVGELLDWHNVLTSTAKLFPICLAAFVITGFYMLSVAHMAIWSSGFVVAGLVGVLFLFASGTFLGIKGNALKQALEHIAAKGAAQPAPILAPPALVAALPLINTGISLGVVFDMATRPASIPVALAVLAFGAVLGAAMGMKRSAPVVKPAMARSATDIG